MEWLAVRLCRLICLLWAEDPGCEVPLSAPIPQGGDGLEARSPNSLGLPILGLGLGGGLGARSSQVPPPGLCASCAGRQRGARPPGLGVSPCSWLGPVQRSDLNGPSAPPTITIIRSMGLPFAGQPEFWEHGDPYGFQGRMRRQRGFRAHRAHTSVGCWPPAVTQGSRPCLPLCCSSLLGGLC